MSLPSGFITAETAAESAIAALPLHVVSRERLADWRASQPAATGAWLDAQGFDGAPGSALLLPGDDGASGAVIGIGDPLDPYSYGHAPFALPPRAFRPAGEHDPATLAALADWLDAVHSQESLSA